MILRFAILGLAALLATVSPAAAQAACAEPAALPSEWSGWDEARALAAVARPADLSAAHFAAGEAIDLALLPDPQVEYVTLPQGEGEAESFGGQARFSVATAGRYGVGLGAGAWVDVTRDGRPTPAVAFGPGPACTAVRKVVAFDLVPGDYVLEISGNETPGLRVMVAAGGKPFPRE